MSEATGSGGITDGMDALTRRRVLQYAGGAAMAVGAGSVLAACGGSSSNDGATPANGAQDASSTGTSGGTPKRGGTLNLGAQGGSDNDTLEAQNLLTNCDFARGYALYEGLTAIDYDGKVINVLAEEMTPSKDAKTWTIRLRPGIKTHDGKAFGAKDVIYSYNRIIKNKFPGAIALGPIDMSSAKAMDERTVRIKFHQPFGILPEGNVLIYCFLVPEGYDPKKPIGTGPYKLTSFTPGQASTMVRHEEYWDQGKPYLDKLVITNIADETAQVSALQSGQVDAIDYLSSTSLTAVKGAGGQAVVAKTGGWGPFDMRMDKDPFSDNRVRTALKLIVNRPEMLSQVFGGQGSIANDLFGFYDPDFDKSIPQRQQDIEQAKSLLKQAGRSDLRLELVTTPNGPGQVQAAQVYASQAKAAGVTVKITNQSPTDYFAKSYLKVPFSQDYWPYLPYLVTASQSTVAGAPYGFQKQSIPAYDALYKKASQTTDDAVRKDTIAQMLKIDHDQGGLIIPYYFPVIDGLSAKVKGVKPSVTGIAMGRFNWKEVWLEG
jgi:peptide/nickel transport system substrate-binding protein